MKRITLAIISVILLVSIANCQSQSSEDIKTQTENSLELRYLVGPNLIAGEILLISIENQSKHCIEFPLDFNIQVYTQINNDWLTVPELGQYFGDGVVTLYPIGDFRNAKWVNVSPDLSGIELPADFYATIIGHLCNDEGISITKKIPFTIAPKP